MESKDFIVIYGVNPISEALKLGNSGYLTKSGKNEIIREIYIAKNRASKLQHIIEIAQQQGIPVTIVNEEYIEKKVQGVHQGIIAKVRKKKTVSIEESLREAQAKGEKPFFIILDLIEDPQNFGAILRVAEAVGVHGVIYQEKRGVGQVPSVWKSSAGAIWHVNLIEINNIKYAIRELKDNGVKIIGAEASAEKSIWQAELSCPLALIFGSEGKGIRLTVRELCDELICIPMRGKINSLNVATSVGIAALETLRQREVRLKTRN
ncbi:23S rRNA (guanosine(2251)-2'-O)-methyltransferase RlmB [Thermodesulfovibrio hydrogeniphilus]